MRHQTKGSALIRVDYTYDHAEYSEDQARARLAVMATGLADLPGFPALVTEAAYFVPGVVYTPKEAEAAWLAGFVAAQFIAGEDAALDAMFDHGILNSLGAAGTLTRDEVVGAFNSLANDVKEEYNPDGYENADSIRSDSCGDLVVNLAVGYLDDPEAEADAIIAHAWHDLDLSGFGPDDDGPAEPGPERDAAIVEEVTSWF